MAYDIIRPASRAEWLEERKNRIGGSEIPAVVGLSPFETPYQLALRKKGLSAPVTENEAMKFGHLDEESVAQLWSEATGYEIIKRSAIDWMVVNHDRPYFSASPDRTFWLDEGRGKDNKGILECKTTRVPVDEDNPPKHWVCQIQWLLGVSELKLGSLAWRVYPHTFGYVDQAFMPDIFAFLSEEAEKFYRDYMIGDKLPECTTVEDIKIKFPRSAERAVDLVQEYGQERALELAAAAADIKALAKEMDAMKKKKEDMENMIKMAFGEADTLMLGDKVLATWKSAKDSVKFDDKAFLTDNPQLAQKYMKTVSGSRRFMIK